MITHKIGIVGIFATVPDLAHMVGRKMTIDRYTNLNYVCEQESPEAYPWIIRGKEEET